MYISLLKFHFHLSASYCFPNGYERVPFVNIGTFLQTMVPYS
jgi:hypothetical protein